MLMRMGRHELPPGTLAAFFFCTLPLPRGARAGLINSGGTIFLSLAVSCAGGSDAGIDASSPP
jgi:hypothetical protein